MQRYFPLPAHGSTTTQCLGAILAVVIVVSLIWWLHPVLDRHEGTAAWVQAAGAILIIGATAWTAGRNSREAEHRGACSQLFRCFRHPHNGLSATPVSSPRR